MKLRNLLIEVNEQGFEINTYLSTPSHLPLDQRFFPERWFELDILERLMNGENIDIKSFSYDQNNRLQNLIDRLMVRVVKGKPEITELGKVFVKQFIEARNQIINQTPINPINKE
ncbi:MAG: hypothetical protein QXU40_04145 [Candidatus Pacearchaeota archaeon]